MKLVFYSNFLNDHQLPLCQEFICKLGRGNFYFVAHEEISKERLELGFEDMNEKYDFVIKSYKSTEEECFAQKLMIDADVVIIGSYVNMPFEERMKLNKLTFRYNERILKRGDLYWFDPRLHLYIYKGWTRYNSSRLYTLCASAYTARDLSLFGYKLNKCLRWGYFPLVREYKDVSELFIRKKEKYLENNKTTILWAGRLIDWKHPEHAVKIAYMLKKEGYSFNLNIIGMGTMQRELEDMINSLGLQEDVHLLGSMPPSCVRERMEESEIFLFTSNRNEGWGVVLNEALNSGCAVVANSNIGSVPYLVKNHINGLIYNNIYEAFKMVKKLLEDNQLRCSLGMRAYDSIIELWNPSTAVTNLLSFIHQENNNLCCTIQDGPCSSI